MSESGYKILVTNKNVPKCALEKLSRSCELVICSVEDVAKKSDFRALLLEKVKGVHGIFWVTVERLDKEVLDAAGPTLKSISTMSAGLDNVDVEEVKKRGIPLGNTAQVLDAAVADCAIGLMISTSRNFQEARQRIIDCNWGVGPQGFLGLDIAGSTVGIVGLGGIGQAIARRLKAFDVSKIVYTGHKSKPEGDELGAEFVSFNDLLKESDFVVVSCPLTIETAGLFNEHAFNMMKRTSIFINISRGGVVDQEALVTALKEKKIHAAGLDVMTPEPLPKDHPLINLPNCTLLPHIGSATINTRNDMATIAAHNVLNGLAGEPMFSPGY